MAIMKIEHDLHMAEGEGEWSYSKNSRRQEIVIRETKPIIENATKEVYTALLPKTMIIVDLGCSAGPNTLLFMSNVIGVIADQCKSSEGDPVELQFFLNDLPGNDFNELFRAIQKFETSGTMDQPGHVPPLHYISGLPGSYYNRLFPRQSVHLFHSSYCLHWRSQVPEGLDTSKEAYLNKDNVYITNTTTPFAVKQFQEQFHKDFSLFLELRHEELVYGGKMVLVFLGRKNEDVYSGELNQLYGLVARSLQSLVLKGLVEKEKLESFNLPVYGPSVAEVKEVVMQSKIFSMDEIKLFEANWDPFDDSEGVDVLDSACSSMNVAKCIRSVLKSLIICHFGETILDPLFVEFASLVAKQLEEQQTKLAVIAMSLKKI
ncbi:hypothetical protein SETIT_2G116600v2 [Setaria italica]|uniref:Benzoate carboxyl methyltransferase n=3 Tax=Setaria italica TaxID=4555 RepID=A0A368PZW4_SETIT|nr:benzoate O-methyltransferase [Setaria italica]RCV10500.1 hypothetical protein SETIT_2G116600v2 [Setaria italica]